MTIEKIIRKLIRKGHPQGLVTAHLIEGEVERNMPNFILYFFLELVKSPPQPLSRRGNEQKSDKRPFLEICEGGKEAFRIWHIFAKKLGSQ